MNQRLIVEAVKNLVLQLSVTWPVDPAGGETRALTLDEQRCAARSLSAMYEDEIEFANERAQLGLTDRRTQ